MKERVLCVYRKKKEDFVLFLSTVFCTLSNVAKILCVKGRDYNQFPSSFTSVPNFSFSLLHDNNQLWSLVLNHLNIFNEKTTSTKVISVYTQTVNTMLKKNLPAAKILLDYDEYLQLLKYKAIVNKEENQSPSENVLKLFSQPTFVDQVEFLRNFNLVPNVSSKTACSFKTNNSVEEVTIKKSGQSDNTLDKLLLKNVPTQYLLRAKKLLKELHKNVNEISWDQTGIICIDNKLLPNSNIKILFPKLFKKVSNSYKVKYLNEFSSKIATLGLGSLINRNLTYGLIRTKSINNHLELRAKINAQKKWWYIGH